MPESTKKTATREPLPANAEQIVERVRQRYAAIAETAEPGCCDQSADSVCAGAEADRSLRMGYESGDLESVPEGADLGLGCGAPICHLDPKPGEVVLDLGSGAGLDALLAARRVDPNGRVIGVDMTPEMIRRATENARRAGLARVEFRQGRLEALPVADASIDAVTSNCVINLVPDKAAVFREIARVLRPGGRLVISDILLDGELPQPLARDLMAYVGCVSGAMARADYFAAVAEAGLSDLEILGDTDLGAAMEENLPRDLRTLLEELGVEVEAIRGMVRSVTFRAVRP